MTAPDLHAHRSEPGYHRLTPLEAIAILAVAILVIAVMVIAGTVTG